jgi:prefoldin subunit 5
MTTPTAPATHLPVGTRVRVVNFGKSSGLTGVVTASQANGFAGWTFVAMDRRATAEESDLGYPNASLVELPEPTVFLVKRPARRPAGDGVEFAATHRAVSAAASIASGTAATGRVDPRVPTLAELRTAGMLPEAPRSEVRVVPADRIAHLEATAERLADRVRVESMARTAAERELAGARVIIEARDNRLAQLEAALERRNRQLATLSSRVDQLQTRARVTHTDRPLRPGEGQR